jgi:hypothetical protein
MRTVWYVFTARTIMVLAVCTQPVPVLAQGGLRIEPPPLVRFTGSFLPLEEKRPGALAMLTVSVEGTQWKFNVAKVEKLTGKEVGSLRLLQSIFPPQLRFTGPDELLRPLQDPQVAGKPLVIEGRLYVGDRMLFVTAVKQLEEHKK